MYNSSADKRQQSSSNAGGGTSQDGNSGVNLNRPSDDAPGDSRDTSQTSPLASHSALRTFLSSTSPPTHVSMSADATLVVKQSPHVASTHLTTTSGQSNSIVTGALYELYEPALAVLTAVVKRRNFDNVSLPDYCRASLAVGLNFGVEVLL